MGASRCVQRYRARLLNSRERAIATEVTASVRRDEGLGGGAVGRIGLVAAGKHAGDVRAHGVVSWGADFRGAAADARDGVGEFVGVQAG